MIELLSKQLGLGPTGHHPEGKLNDSDNGELKLAVTVNNGRVMLIFGTPVTWLILPPQQARDLAAILLKQAGVAEN